MTTSANNVPPGTKTTKLAPVDRAPSGEGTHHAEGPIAATLAELKTSDRGLSAAEAARRLALYGPNRLADRPRHEAVWNFLKRLANPLVLVLLGAAVMSAATGDPTSFAIITTVVFASVILDYVQEHRAEMAAASLRDQVALHVNAIRDGHETDILASDVVPGDVVVLVAGDLVPADCRLIAAKDVFVNEALLTGESYPAEKHARDVPTAEDADAVFRDNAVFMGSSIVSGVAKAVVINTGRKTQLGSIAISLIREPPPTAFALGIRDFGYLIVRLTVLLTLFVLIVNLFFHRPLLESVLFALALAVGLTPELLPMVISVTLARGALRMSERKVIVKRLSAIHDLGSMDVLCSDKTGTLTDAHIVLDRHIDIAGAPSAHVGELAYLNAVFETGVKSPLDQAILASQPAVVPSAQKIDEVPFDFDRRRVSVLVEDARRRRLIVKGAPEDVLKLSSHVDLAGSDVPEILSEAKRAQALALLAGLGAQGFRALGVAWRDVEPTREHASLQDETELTFAGFSVFLDPPKASARAALDALRRLNVDLKIVTGDNEHITRHVCEALGLEVKGVVTGPELGELTDEALPARLAAANVFCRITPTQKSRIISGLRRRGHVVGYIGDGINDAPSLHAADVGISVNGAVDVAKEAASMILLENDLGVLADGVREGRRTFANILKYVMMGTSSNFGNMFSMAGGVLFLPFLPMLPVQILLNNLLYDVSEIAIPLDAVDDDMIERPRRWDMKFVRDFMLVLGPVSSLFDFVTFGVLLWGFGASETQFHSGWFVESMATQVLVIFVIRTRGSPLKSRPNRWLAIGSLGVVGLVAILPYTAVGAWFGLTPLPIALMATLAATTAVYLVLVEVVKRWFYSRHPVVSPTPGQGPLMTRAALRMS